MDNYDTVQKYEMNPISRRITMSEIWKRLDKKYTLNPDYDDEKQSVQQMRNLQNAD